MRFGSLFLPGAFRSQCVAINQSESVLFYRRCYREVQTFIKVYIEHTNVLTINAMYTVVYIFGMENNLFRSHILFKIPILLK